MHARFTTLCPSASGWSNSTTSCTVALPSAERGLSDPDPDVRRDAVAKLVESAPAWHEHGTSAAVGEKQ